MKVWPFFQYFFMYIARTKTRQRLLFIAVISLFLSAFSLIVIQGIMGGLQNGLVSRSKSVHGHYLLQFEEASKQDLQQVKEYLIKEAIPFYSELEVEVMLKNKNFMAPAKLHGIDLQDEKPEFLAEKDFSGLVLGSDLSSKIKAQMMDEVQIISPGVTDSLMGEVPRFVTGDLSDYLYTEVSEVDDFEVFTRLSLVQNLLRSPTYNQLRIFRELDDATLNNIQQLSPEGTKLLTWEDMNGALVWSLNLETKVMLFLFISMSLLVAIAITSGLLIFYDKIKKDLMSFWILGMGQKKIIDLTFRFTLLLSACTCFLGVLAGSAFLILLEKYGHTFMPDVFVERQLPVHFTATGMVISLLIPFGISCLFSWFSFNQFRKENQSFVSIVRSLS